MIRFIKQEIEIEEARLEYNEKQKGEKCYLVAYELYGKNILDEEQVRGILETKNRAAEIDRDSKSKDDDMEL